jgi:hypothetical protein
MDVIRSTKISHRNGHQFIQVPSEWHYSVEALYVVKDQSTGNLILSPSLETLHFSTLSRLIGDLCTGWVAFTILVILTALDQKLIAYFVSGQPELQTRMHGIDLAAYIFEFILFATYHVLKLYQFLHPELIVVETEGFLPPQETWATFAKSATSDFLKQYARIFRARNVQANPIDSRLDSSVTEVSLVAMMKTAMGDENIRRTLKANGFSDELIDHLLKPTPSKSVTDRTDVEWR